MYIVSEIGASHNGSKETALKLIEHSECANFVKFQTFKPEKMAVDYVIPRGLWKGRQLKELYKEAYTPWEWLPILFEKAYTSGLIPFSTPFCRESVDYLETLDCPIYKIASFELVDLPLIAYTASTKKPIIMSTGSATSEEIGLAVETAREFTEDITLLHCISEYPAPLESMKLETMIDLQGFGVKVGLSDHSKGYLIPQLATAMGASMIEKHIRLDESLDSFALNPNEFKEMCQKCREVEKTLGIKYGGNTELRRSLYYTKDLKKGTTLSDSHIMTRRPELGLSPTNNVIGQTLKEDVKMNQPVLVTEV